jgi:hypothetical protein
MARTRQTSRYGADPRVVREDDGTFTVTAANGAGYSVRWTETFDWMVIDQTTGQIHQTADDFAINLPTVDDAIRVVIGDPQR